MANGRLFEVPAPNASHEHVLLNVNVISSLVLRESVSTPLTVPPISRWTVALTTPDIVYTTEFESHDLAHEFLNLWSSRIEDANPTYSIDTTNHTVARVTAVSSVILAANANRRRFVLYNNSGAAMFI